MTIGPGRAIAVSRWRNGEEGLLQRGAGFRPFLLLGLGLALLGFALAYASTFQTLFRVWLHNPNYSHGFLIPPVAAWLLWRQRRALALDAARPAWAGMLLLVPAFLLQIAGLRGDVMILQGTSLVLALAGIVWQIHGGVAIRRAAFPLAFLFFMIPALPWFMNTVSFQLKVLAARSAVATAQAMGVAVQRDGVNLNFPTGTLAVEGACSGLHSLVALMALGALFAYFSRGGIIQRIALFVLSVPIAVIANALRVSSLCVYAGLAGPQAAAGRFHDVGGYALFAVAFLLLAIAKKVLRC